MDFFHYVEFVFVPGHRPRAPVRGPRARARVGPSLTAPGAHRSQVLPGERMLGPPELWPVRHYAAPQAVLRLLSLLHFQHLAVP